ncbi:MAG: ABC transporter ATP-binding protein [Gammaproteobacteria bacterium]|nr:ABC transporter ATP-binding protein [Gammaproteobacteria bacterium]
MKDSAVQLRLDHVFAGYGETVVLEDIDIDFSKGESISIIGRNGVGKSTLLETIMGHTTLHRGSVHLGNTEITNLKPYRRVWRGLGYVPQEREIFSSLTVEENLVVAIHNGSGDHQRVYDLFPQLGARRNHMGNQLSGGEQQMLAIGRGLLGNPSVLLMDEPSEGLAPVIVEELQYAMTQLRQQEDMTIVLVEQNSRVALDFAERCVVMNRGQIVRDGPSDELKSKPELLDQLIGVDVI